MNTLILMSSTPLKYHATFIYDRPKWFMDFFFFMFFGTAVEFGWPERSAAFVSVRQRLKPAYYLLIVAIDESKSE